MIDELRIRDLGVIADATLPLGPGFTAITGETGAGKTMVVSALGLLMGERSDAGAVRTGASQARVNGLVHTADPAVAEIVDELGGDVEDGELVLSRTVSAEGRSRASVGGASAPVGSLTRLADRLFAVHGQSEQLRLRSAAAQRDTLDRFGGAEIEATLTEYRTAHRNRRELGERVAELTAARDERAAEAARLRAELDEIAQVDPQPGEDTELAARIDLLSNVEALREATVAAHEALATESDDPMSRDAGSLVDAAIRDLERVAAHDERLGSVLETLRGVSFQIADSGKELAAYVDDLDVEGPGELARANERLAALNALFRLYGVDAAAVIEYSARSAARLTELEGDDDLIVDLAAQLDIVTASERALADQLTAQRTAAAAKLSQLVTVELRQLALPDAEFQVLVTPLDTLGNAGGDEVQLLLSPHPGATPRPIAKSASGGELSRVMLALEVVVAGVDPVPTFVFDEVDAGVGGAAAIEIGRRLARLARSSQVIVVTHLAQVAAFAGNHLQVVKDSAGGFTESSCRRLDGEARLAEMARLLSGLSDSESALEHAAELLALREA
ncbi:DNA replication and repair protein RecN [Leucobacter luti]|uniref:DNA repair protein RecN n=1 Tax=Leucobacter luti TaxID=340320 RepID=UPI0010535465|nr:DNA repair protein RecN [Leucobacter luti]MCW2286912.1 DNA repair protein RecN (Recombination protein N) [Leucobacter luti]TCK41141.1 DNA replication and repair protein RecN [Leucobacter luti]